MATLIYTEKDNGDLKLLAEIEENVEDGEAVELLLAESPRLKSDRFVVLAGSLEDGVISVVEQQEEVRVRWTSSRGNGNGAAVVEDETPAAAPKRRGRPPGSKNKTTAASTDDAPKRRRGRPPGSKNKPGAAKPGPKAGAKRGRGRPPGSKNKTTSTRRTVKAGGSGFKRNAGSDE